jgi:galactose mutarotase-like enzyme
MAANSTSSTSWCANGEEGGRTECEEIEDGVSMSDTRMGWGGRIVTFGLTAVSGNDDDRRWRG